MADPKILIEGAALRWLVLSTHYRQPLNFTASRLAESEKVLRKLCLAAKPNDSTPPAEFMECLCDDLNTPKMIAMLHVWRRDDQQKLFAALRWLGFFGDQCMPDETKTLPPEGRPGSSFTPGMEVLGHA